MDDASRQHFESWAASRVAQLHRTAYLLVGDWHVAEDLVQESLTKVALHWKRVEQMEHPDAYTRRIVVNQARQRWRRRSSRETPVDVLHEDITTDGAQERAERAALLGALDALPRRQRAVLVLRYFEQLSEAETAAAMDCSVGTVKSQASRALASLRRTMTIEEPPCPTT